MKRAKKSKGKSFAEDFHPTYLALAVATVAVVSIVAFTVIGWSMSL